MGEKGVQLYCRKYANRVQVGCKNTGARPVSKVPNQAKISTVYWLEIFNSENFLRIYSVNPAKFSKAIEPNSGSYLAR